MMCDEAALREMEEGDALGIASLLQMDVPPVHIIISGPVEAENKGDFSKALRLYEELEVILDEWMQGAYLDRAMLEKEEVKQIVSEEKMLHAAIHGLDEIVDGTPNTPDNFVLYLSQHLKRQKMIMLRRHEEGGEASNETSVENHSPINCEVVRRVKYGIIRNLLRLWRIDEGLQLLDNIYGIDDPEFLIECAEIIQKHSNFEVAANLYERGRNIPKSVECYILAKDLHTAKLVLESTPDPEGFKLIARAYEVKGKFEEAAKFYGISGDIDSAVKIYLKLKLPEEALLLLKEHPGVSSASVESVADFLLNSGEGHKESALDLLVSIGRVKEAARIADKHNLQKDLVEKVYRAYVMEKRTEIPREFESSLNDAILSMMSKNRTSSDLELDCGTSFALLGKYEAAYPLLLKVVQESAGKPDYSAKENRAFAFLKLIAANIKDENVRDRIIKLLEGGVEGISKNSTHLCDYYVVEKRWLDAAKVKKRLSEDLLKKGEVKPAYAAIVEGMRFLFRRDSGEIDVHEMSRDLVEYLDYFHILHSFRLMTMHVNLKSFHTAAYLAYRLRTNVGLFPKPTQSLILSTGAMYAQATQCGSIAKELAVQLMKDKELVSHVSPNHKSAIENIVRKKPVPCSVEKSCCPRCKAYVDVWSLQCPNCAMLMSMCVISGKHLSAGEITSCRACHFPMNQSELEHFVKIGLEICPICKDQMVALPDPEIFGPNASLSSIFGQEEDFDEEPETYMLTHRPSFTNYDYCDQSPCEYYCDADADERRMDMEMNAHMAFYDRSDIIMSSRLPSGTQTHRSFTSFVPQSPPPAFTRGNVYPPHFTPTPRNARRSNYDFDEHDY